MNTMLFADKLRYLRGRRSQTEIARELDIRQQSYASYEIGRNEPCLAILRKIADLHKVSLDWLVSDLPLDSKTAFVDTGEVFMCSACAEKDKIIERQSKALKELAELYGKIGLTKV